MINARAVSKRRAFLHLVQYVLLLQKQKQTEQTQKRKRDNKQPIGKQHTDNQSKEDVNHRGGKVEKEEESERGKKSK